MITADQILLHCIGDYVLQSDWMAVGKTTRFLPALCHASVYSIPFLVFSPNVLGWLFIFLTHFYIDRYRLARYLVWAKNFLAPVKYNKSWSECSTTGYPNDRPVWLTVWLFIICDNVLHLVCNGMALKYL